MQICAWKKTVCNYKRMNRGMGRMSRGFIGIYRKFDVLKICKDENLSKKYRLYGHTLIMQIVQHINSNPNDINI